jgi:hypothetical protein
METMILIAIGIVVGLIVARQAFSPPTRETIVIVPVEAAEPAPEGLGCLPLIAVGVLILLILSSGRL